MKQKIALVTRLAFALVGFSLFPTPQRAQTGSDPSWIFNKPDVMIPMRDDVFLGDDFHPSARGTAGVPKSSHPCWDFPRAIGVSWPPVQKVSVPSVP